MEYKYPPEEILSRSFFFAETEEFFRFYREKILNLSAQPNPAHYKLAELETAGKLTAVVTQNIDGLHQSAGSRNVIELHGSVNRNRCLECGKNYDAGYIKGTSGIPRCACGGVIKPDVVLYGEALNDSVIRRAISSLSSADTLIIAGTSMTVYPAAGLVDRFKGNHIVLINRDITPYDRKADLIIRDSVGKVFSGIKI